jgi:Rrf2 family transcriptional regulator, iron-sulfur cluster assembly transcription factor
MKLTTKGKFAVTAVLDMALNIGDDLLPVTLHHISKRQGISLSYLEQLFVKLRREGLVKSFKGPGGGYVLDRELRQISVSQIIRAVDDDLDARTCHGMKNCRGGTKKCLTHDLWNGLTNYIYEYLDHVTLHDLVENHKNMDRKTGFDVVSFLKA